MLFPRAGIVAFILLLSGCQTQMMPPSPVDESLVAKTIRPKAHPELTHCPRHKIKLNDILMYGPDPYTCVDPTQSYIDFADEKAYPFAQPFACGRKAESGFSAPFIAQICAQCDAEEKSDFEKFENLKTQKEKDAFIKKRKSRLPQ